LLEYRADLSADERQQALEHLAVKQSLLNLTTFPFVASAIERGALELHGAWFAIGKGHSCGSTASTEHSSRCR
jgi:carbonic anhydrase